MAINFSLIVCSILIRMVQIFHIVYRVSRLFALAKSYNSRCEIGLIISAPLSEQLFTIAGFLTKAYS